MDPRKALVGRPKIFQSVLNDCFLISLALIAVALHFWGAKEVRTELTAVVILTVFGGFGLVAAINLFSWFGVSLRDDVVERTNPAALTALCGAVPAVALVYAGGSLGEGPSYLNNVFSAGLGMCGWFSLWLVLELCAHVSRSVAEERDLASGLRLGGFLLAAGLICARAVAGNWHSEMATLRDFVHDGWPAAVLLALAIGVEWIARPSRAKPFPPWITHGLIPVLLYLLLAALWLWHAGKWEGFPQ